MQVSVVLPTFNRAQLLPRALNSALAQTHPHLEVIVVDDGSFDSTSDLSAHYQKHPQVRWLRTTNRGVSAARNWGVKHSQGEYFAFLDSDDEWLPQKITRQLELMTKEGRRWCHTEELWLRNGQRFLAKKKHRKGGGWQFLRSLQICCISPSAVLMERELFEKAGGFREDYPVCEDYDLWVKLTLDHPISFVSEPLVKRYGGHPDQLSHKLKAMDQFRAQSLQDLLDQGSLHPHLRDAVLKQLWQRLLILEKGYAKHSRWEALSFVTAWMSQLREVDSNILSAEAATKP